MKEKLRLILERLRAYAPEKVILFGSQARGEADEYSDVDLVIIKDTDKRFIDRLLEVSRILGPDLDKVDLLVYTPMEWLRMIESGNPLALEAVEKGRIIYEKGKRRGFEVAEAGGTRPEGGRAQP